VVVCERAVVPVPDVAVMVTVLVPAGVPDDFDEELPPQPLAIPPMPNNSSTRPSTFDRRLRPLTKNKPMANTTPPPANGHGLTFRPLAAAVVMVIVLLAAAPFGVTDAGEKLHPAAAGNPEHANEVA
jgi:hypothetical protein